jgi:transposase
VASFARFGIKLPSRAGGKKFDEAAYLATRNDPILHSAIRALLESLASIEGQQARLDDELDELAKRNEIAWRLMSVPGVGRITALAYMAAIENVERFRRTRDIGAYLGLTERRYQSAETDVGMGISKQGDAMARHYLYEAANVLLTTVKKRFAPADLGSEAGQDDRPEARPSGGREKAGCAAWTTVERWRAL